MNHHAPDYHRDKGVLPPFATAWGCVQRSISALGPTQRISVPAAAEQYRRLDDPGYRGAWSNSVVPYMVEPGEVMTSRRFEGEIFVGPARTGKTAAILENTVAHRVMCMPRNMLIIHMTNFTARKFSKEKIDKMLRVSPELKAKLRVDNTFDKEFAQAMRLSIGWPVISQLSAADIPDVIFTDYDRQPDDIDGEGEPFALGQKRTQTFGSLGKVAAESSPGRPILDEDWVERTPHEPPPCTGILGLYAQGTRGRWYWPCMQCGNPFEARFDYLNWPEGAPAIEAGEQAVMVCPDCGYPTPASAKGQLNAAGYWLHEGRKSVDWRRGDKASIEDLVKSEILVRLDGDVRPASLASHWMQGPAAAFQTWGQLVERHVVAVEHMRATGDEGKLKTTTNVDKGLPYRPTAMSASVNMTAEALEDNALDLPGKLTPSGTRFFTIQVDVQGNRFVVQADAWGVGLERWMIDRFEIFNPRSDEERGLDPARYRSDWDLLFPLLERRYEVDGTGFTLAPMGMTVDLAGKPGVTAQAYAFWRRARKRGLGTRILLCKGNHIKRGQPENQRRAYKAFPERSTDNGKKKTLDVPVIWMGTDVLKDEISAALTMEETGPGSYRVLNRVDKRVFAELSAERRTDKGWEKKPGQERNEAFDLAVYGKGLVLIKGGEKIDWGKPVNWAAPMDQNVYAEPVEHSAREVKPKSAPPPSARKSRRRGGFMGNNSNFMGR